MARYSIVRFPGDDPGIGIQPVSPREVSTREVGSVVIATAAVSLLPTEAHAYIDPGAGSVLLQAAIGAAAAAAIVVKTYWVRIKRVFSPRSRRPVEPQPSPDAGPGKRD